MEKSKLVCLFSFQNSYKKGGGKRVDFSLALKKKKKDRFVFICTEEAGERERTALPALGNGVRFSSLSRSWTVKAVLGSRTSPLFPKLLFARYSGMPTFWQRIKNFFPNL